VTTAIIWDERYTYHEMGYLHPESPKRLLVIKEVLDGDGVGKVLVHLEPRYATREEIAYIHDDKYIERVAATDGIEMTHLDPDTSANRYTWDAAQLAAGGAIVCVDEVLAGHYNNAFAFIRPPGHHAERDRAMGFCFFNNVAIAAEHLIKNRNVDRIAIIDFDVHHGNGTQHAFYERPDVFFVSVHRDPFYPGSGQDDETGEGEGTGYTLNIPMKGGAGDDDYRRTFDVIAKKVENYKPQFILVSAGFDAHVRDSLGGMKVTTGGYRHIMKAIMEFASGVCDGKTVAILEGGYDLQALRDSVEAQLEVMAEI